MDEGATILEFRPRQYVFLSGRIDEVHGLEFDIDHPGKGLVQMGVTTADGRNFDYQTTGDMATIYLAERFRRNIDITLQNTADGNIALTPNTLQLASLSNKQLATYAQVTRLDNGEKSWVLYRLSGDVALEVMKAVFPLIGSKFECSAVLKRTLSPANKLTGILSKP